ncbi:MAG TPA: ribbon-helix-helix protein, CopG family [Acidimicrobiales bacterium]|nr:ribbon-helix-helix protein, CopG family [Acidimicrobiales bacterium]
MPDTKNLLLRLDPELAAQLQAIAAVEERPMSEVVREAIRALVEARRNDEEFQRRLRGTARQHARVLRALRAGDDG